MIVTLKEIEMKYKNFHETLIFCVGLVNFLWEFEFYERKGHVALILHFQETNRLNSLL